jgi:hypothetical protein
MLEDEIEKSLSDNGIETPVIWIDRGLHEYPDKLRLTLQEKIDELRDVPYILLAFCLCGNSVHGLYSDSSCLVIPKFDDCIHMYMAKEAGKPPEVKMGLLYYTKGWLDCDSSLLQQLQDYNEQYGEEDAQALIEMMYKDYTGMRLIDTGAYDVGRCMDIVKRSAEVLDMDVGVCRGTLRVIDKLLCGQWDDEFCVIPPGERISSEHFKDRVIR